MSELKGSRTQDNLKAAFAGESQARKEHPADAGKPSAPVGPPVAPPALTMSAWPCSQGAILRLCCAGSPPVGVPVGPSPPYGFMLPI